MPHPTEPVTLDLELDLIEGIEAFSTDEGAPLSRTEAIRMIIRDWLIGHGYLPPDDA